MDQIEALLPPLLPGAFEQWVAAALAVGGGLLMYEKLFKNRGPRLNGSGPVPRQEFAALADKLDAVHDAVSERQDKHREELLSRLDRLQTEMAMRFARTDAAIARLEERTRV